MASYRIREDIPRVLTHITDVFKMKKRLASNGKASVVSTLLPPPIATAGSSSRCKRKTETSPLIEDNKRARIPTSYETPQREPRRSARILTDGFRSPPTPGTNCKVIAAEIGWDCNSPKYRQPVRLDSRNASVSIVKEITSVCKTSQDNDQSRKENNPTLDSWVLNDRLQDSREESSASPSGKRILSKRNQGKQQARLMICEELEQLVNTRARRSRQDAVSNSVQEKEICTTVVKDEPESPPAEGTCTAAVKDEPKLPPAERTCTTVVNDEPESPPAERTCTTVVNDEPESPPAERNSTLTVSLDKPRVPPADRDCKVAANDEPSEPRAFEDDPQNGSISDAEWGDDSIFEDTTFLQQMQESKDDVNGTAQEEAENRTAAVVKVKPGVPPAQTNSAAAVKHKPGKPRVVEKVPPKDGSTSDGEWGDDSIFEDSIFLQQTQLQNGSVVSDGDWGNDSIFEDNIFLQKTQETEEQYYSKQGETTKVGGGDGSDTFQTPGVHRQSNRLLLKRSTPGTPSASANFASRVSERTSETPTATNWGRNIHTFRPRNLCAPGSESGGVSGEPLTTEAVLLADTHLRMTVQSRKTFSNTKANVISTTTTTPAAGPANAPRQARYSFTRGAQPIGETRGNRLNASKFGGVNNWSNSKNGSATISRVVPDKPVTVGGTSSAFYPEGGGSARSTTSANARRSEGKTLVGVVDQKSLARNEEMEMFDDDDFLQPDVISLLDALEQPANVERESTSRTPAQCTLAEIQEKREAALQKRRQREMFRLRTPIKN